MRYTSQFLTRIVRAAQLCCLLGVMLAISPVRAQVIFDVFVGHGIGLSDSTVAEAAWFPVTCEIQNDGPSFNAIVEISGGQFGGGQTRFVEVELPTNTRKRFVVPVYCTTRYRMSVDAKLRNEKGKVVAEHQGIEARAVADWQSPLVASLSRTHGGAVTFPEGGKNNQLRPAATRLTTELFPDNPLTLESISSLYLHSARAAELKQPQVTALLAWLHNGGHLILAVENPGDVNGVPWLKGLLPCSIGDVQPRRDHAAMQQWLTRRDAVVLRARPNQSKNNSEAAVTNPFLTLKPDETFENAELPVVQATIRDGTALIGTAEAPLAVAASRGRGQISVLLFSPELEPFRSWRNRLWFWAKLTDVPIEWLANANVNSQGSQPLDGAFGAMVDSKQIRKLPIGWLLLLLLAYLVVIGPLDQYWLKKIKKQMLTWVTFPSYVVLFSLLIYFIGYKLRSGEMEWNELHIVDVTPHSERADLRGRVFCSAYSPANAKYAVASEGGFSTLRGEVGQGGAQEVSKAAVHQRGDGFTAQISVPVWTSQLFVNDWWRQGVAPLQVSMTPRADGFELTIENPGGKRIPQARLVFDNRVYELGDITRGTKKRVFQTSSGTPLQPLVQKQAEQINAAINARQQQFGGNELQHIHDVFNANTAISFLSVASVNFDANQPWNPGYWNRFVTSPGIDLTPLIQRGDAILLAWMPGDTVVPMLNRFSPRYSKKDTVLRVLVPVRE